jgi:hypothetical protein
LIYNEKLDQMLAALEKVKRSNFTARARCPVHGSKGQTLSVTAKEGGYIVANCFSCGADGLAVVRALGLPASILFPDSDWTPPTVTRKMRKQAAEDVAVIQTIKEPKTLAEFRAVQKSRERLKGVEQKILLAENEPPEIAESHSALIDFKIQFGDWVKRSPILRAEIVEAFWEGIQSRVRMIERRMIETSQKTTKKAKSS